LKRFLYTGLLLNYIFGFQLYAQETNHKISFTHDNDLYFLTDRYYSAGSHLSFGFNFEHKKENKNTFNFTLGQNIYTPDKKRLADTTRFDRPFAGWLFFKTEYLQSTHDKIWAFQIDLGLTGSQSLADKTQRNYHRLIGEQVPSWFLQIPNDFHSDIGFRYQQGFLDNKVISYSSVKIGTRDIYIQNGLELFWGSHRSFIENAFTGIAKHSDKEWFLNFGTYYKYVFHNALIEGHLFNNNAVFTKEIENHLLLFTLRGFYRWKKNSIEFSYHFNSKENNEAKSHSFLSITLSKYF